MSNLVDAVKTGDELEIYLALRDRLAQEIDDCNSARDIAALTRQLTDVLDRIEAFPDAEHMTVAEAVAKKRAERLGEEE